MHYDNSCDRQIVAHGVEIWSSSPSFMKFITHANMQVPITSGILFPNADSSGTAKEHHILIISCHFFDL